MAQWVVKEAKNTEHKILAIAHTNCPERAQKVKQYICEQIKVKGVYLVDTAGVSTTYAGDGGIIIAL